MPNDSSTGGYILPSTTPPVEDIDLDVLMQNLVVGCTGLPPNYVRPRWQLVPPVQPEVTVDWCAVGVQEVVPEDGNASNVFDGTKTTTAENPTLSVMVSFYGPHATLNAQNFRMGVMIPQNREALFHQNMALAERPGPIVNAPSLAGDRMQRRADVSFKLRRLIEAEWPIKPIVTAVVDIWSDNADQNPVETATTPHSLNPLTE